MSKKDLNFYKKNAEEDYMKTPISVLRYITELEQAQNEVNDCMIPDVRRCECIEPIPMANRTGGFTCRVCERDI